MDTALPGTSRVTAGIPSRQRRPAMRLLVLYRPMLLFASNVIIECKRRRIIHTNKKNKCKTFPHMSYRFSHIYTALQLLLLEKGEDKKRVKEDKQRRGGWGRASLVFDLWLSTWFTSTWYSRWGTRRTKRKSIRWEGHSKYIRSSVSRGRERIRRKTALISSKACGCKVTHRRIFLFTQCNYCFLCPPVSRVIREVVDDDDNQKEENWTTTKSYSHKEEDGQEGRASTKEKEGNKGQLNRGKGSARFPRGAITLKVLSTPWQPITPQEIRGLENALVWYTANTILRMTSQVSHRVRAPPP